MNLYWFIKKSILLDFLFLRVCRWSIQEKLFFLIKKYIEIANNLTGINKFNLGESNLTLFNKKIYYDSALGLADYQSILARHNYLIQIAEISEVKYVVDVGANVGFFSLLIRELFPASKIIAIEPSEKTYKALEMNFKDDKNIHLFQTAISDKNGFARLVFDPETSAISSIVRNNRNKVRGRQIIEKVKTITLDRLIFSTNIPYIDILKIDVESFEKQVLLGSRETLKKTKYLFLEITVADNNNYSFSEINSLLYGREHNFQLVGFRNYADVSQGKLPLGDFLYKNIYFEKNK